MNHVFQHLDYMCPWISVLDGANSSGQHTHVRQISMAYNISCAWEMIWLQYNLPRTIHTISPKHNTDFLFQYSTAIRWNVPSRNTVNTSHTHTHTLFSNSSNTTNSICWKLCMNLLLWACVCVCIGFYSNSVW